MDFQHFRVKIFAKPAGSNGPQPDLHQAIPMFHRWIREKWLAENAIDVSDYLHVPAGPGVILVCHEAIYGLDLEKHRLGLIYNRRSQLEGPTSARLKQAVDAARAAVARMEAEPEFTGKLAFDATEWEVAVNDRALAPNTVETLAAVSPVLRDVFTPLFGKEPAIVHNSGPGELFRVHVSAPAA